MIAICPSIATLGSRRIDERSKALLDHSMAEGGATSDGKVVPCIPIRIVVAMHVINPPLKIWLIAFEPFLERRVQPPLTDLSFRPISRIRILPACRYRAHGLILSIAAGCVDFGKRMASPRPNQVNPSLPQRRNPNCRTEQNMARKQNHLGNVAQAHVALATHEFMGLIP